MPWTLCPQGTFNGLSAATIPAVLGNPVARFFLSGDGHGTPPFQWAVRPAVKEMFLTLQANDQLCFHVEELPENVTSESIPQVFDPVFVRQKVFGWELPMFRDLQPVMERCLDISSSEVAPSDEDVNGLHDSFVTMDQRGHQVNDPPWLAAAVAISATFKAYRTKVGHYWIDPRRIDPIPKTEADYKTFVLGYFNNAMQLRTGANNFIGARIAANIALHPNDTHLITVGDAHILVDPVQQYIPVPLGQTALIDVT